MRNPLAKESQSFGNIVITESNYVVLSLLWKKHVSTPSSWMCKFPLNELYRDGTPISCGIFIRVLRFGRWSLQKDANFGQNIGGCVADIITFENNTDTRICEAQSLSSSKEESVRLIE